MFLYMRWFSAITLALLACFTLYAEFYFTDTLSESFIKFVEINNTTLAQRYKKNVWDKYSNSSQKLLNTLSDISPQPIESVLEKRIPENFSSDTFTFFQNTARGFEFYIYTKDGSRIAASSPEAKENDLKKSDKDFITALTGLTVTNVWKKQALSDNGNVSKHSDNQEVFIRTFYPIMRDMSNKPKLSGYNQPGIGIITCSDIVFFNCVEGVAEVRYNVTIPWHRLAEKKGALYSINGSFILILLILYWIFHNAENTFIKQRKINADLAEKTSIALAENTNKSTFLANFSHELRTPLNVIISYTEFMKRERAGAFINTKYIEYIHDIHSSSSHLLSLVNDILDYSRAETRTLELAISEVDITKLIRSTIRLMLPRAKNADVQILENLPPGEHVFLKTDGKKFKQIMLNLLSNAVKFTLAGGSVTVIMWKNNADGSLFIKVQDTGIGIAQKDIERAMEPFGQITSKVSRLHEGTGLGLPLTKKFVGIMGGTFDISSEVGIGTTITLRF